MSQDDTPASPLRRQEGGARGCGAACPAASGPRLTGARWPSSRAACRSPWGPRWSLPAAARYGRANRLYNVDRVSKSEGLDALPTDYSKLPPALPPMYPSWGRRCRAISARHREVAAPVTPPTRLPATTRTMRCEGAEAAAASSGSARVRGGRAGRKSQAATAPGFAANAAFDPMAAGPASTAAQPADRPPCRPEDQKEAFLKGGSTETRNSGNLTLPASPYQVMAGRWSPERW